MFGTGLIVEGQSTDLDVDMADSPGRAKGWHGGSLRFVDGRDNAPGCGQRSQPGGLAWTFLRSTSYVTLHVRMRLVDRKGLCRFRMSAGRSRDGELMDRESRVRHWVSAFSAEQH
ncbi:hypothetical protein [Nocardia exalbida]|uniref:hypothetical protein n=1 Tax=Nocardia exalbida TaxID=290231 RepID=UPI0012F707F2|nr:hypothetical protein [Nocardia exalbida]